MNTEPYFELHKVKALQADTVVFNKLSLSLKLGENCCLLGANGAGKSTIIKLLYRQIHPVVRADSYIKWFGKERWVTAKLKQNFGLVSQDLQSQYDAHIKGIDVVMSGLFSSVGIHGHMLVSDEHRQQALAIMQQFGLQNLSERRYWHLSTGQQRRLLLARAMINKPQVLVLDEPTNGLDLQAGFELLAELRSLCQQNTTLFLVTHHLQEIIPEINRVITLQGGEIALDGDKAQVLTSANLTELYQTPVAVIEQNGYYQAVPGAN